MPRPVCDSCGGICIDPASLVEVRQPHRPAAAFTVCSDCAFELVRRLSARRPVPSPDPPLLTVTR